MYVQVIQAESLAGVVSELDLLTFNLAKVSNRTDEATSSYPTDLMNANSLLQFVLKYVTLSSYVCPLCVCSVYQKFMLLLDCNNQKL